MDSAGFSVSFLQCCQPLAEPQSTNIYRISQCMSLVGIGTLPPPSLAKRVCPSPCGLGVGEVTIPTIGEKLSTLPTLGAELSSKAGGKNAATERK
jgi:hypothetical protein